MPFNVIVAAFVASAVVAAPAEDAGAASSEADAISAFVKAWDAADSTSLAQLFELDGRLVIPTGHENSGRDAIRAFYSGVFKSGYRGSSGGAKVTRITKLSDTLSLVEGEWSIRNAKQADGSPRPSEAGQFSAILRANPGGWRLAVLREMTLAE